MHRTAIGDLDESLALRIGQRTGDGQHPANAIDLAAALLTASAVLGVHAIMLQLDGDTLGRQLLVPRIHP